MLYANCIFLKNYIVAKGLVTHKRTSFDVDLKRAILLLRSFVRVVSSPAEAVLTCAHNLCFEQK